MSLWNKKNDFCFKWLCKTNCYKTEIIFKWLQRDSNPRHLVRKRTLNHVAGLAKRVRDMIRTYSQRSFFFSFCFLIGCCISTFSFFIKAFLNFEKLIRFHRQAFIAYKIREKLKILMDDRNISPKSYSF